MGCLCARPPPKPQPISASRALTTLLQTLPDNVDAIRAEAQLVAASLSIPQPPALALPHQLVRVGVGARVLTTAVAARARAVSRTHARAHARALKAADVRVAVTAATGAQLKAAAALLQLLACARSLEEPSVQPCMSASSVADVGGDSTAMSRPLLQSYALTTDQRLLAMSTRKVIHRPSLCAGSTSSLAALVRACLGLVAHQYSPEHPLQAATVHFALSGTARPVHCGPTPFESQCEPPCATEIQGARGLVYGYSSSSEPGPAPPPASLVAASPRSLPSDYASPTHSLLLSRIRSSCSLSAAPKFPAARAAGAAGTAGVATTVWECTGCIAQGTLVHSLPVSKLNKTGIAVSADGSVLAIALCNGTITLQCASTGEALRTIGCPGPMSSHLTRIAFASNGNLLLCCRTDACLRDVTQEGEEVRRLGTALFSPATCLPNCVDVRRDVVAVGCVEGNGPRVVLLSYSRDQLMHVFGDVGVGREQMSATCTGVRMSADGMYLVVAELEAQRVSWFSADGRLMHRTHVDVTSLDGRSKDVALTGAGEVAVADPATHSVRVLSADGREEVRRWGTFGTLVGQFHTPCALAVAGPYLYVLDCLSTRVQVFA